MPGLTRGELMRVVNRYIGVSGGYLGDLSYQSHHDFYPEYCELDYNPYDHDGTTRERFIAILSAAPPEHQARILRGVVERFPVDALGAPQTRTDQLRDELLRVASRLEAAAPVSSPDIRTHTRAVERALADAEALVQTTGAPSAVDRVHTALHAYLRALCESEGLEAPADAGATQLFKLLREHHPKLAPTGPRANDITKLLRSISAILDALSPVRNRASAAHPNPELLEPPEATLVVNLVRSLLHYINMRVGNLAG